MAEGRELEFGCEITQESQFVEIPDGEYQFQVESIERGRHNGSEKIPPCNKLIVHFNIFLPDGREGHIQEQFIMWSTMEWKLSQFFISIRMKKKGEPMPASNWFAEIPGRKGRCKIKKQADRNDPTKTYAHIDEYLEPQPMNFNNGF